MKEEKDSSNNCPIISKKTKRNNYKFFYRLIGNNIKIERRLYKVFVTAFVIVLSIFIVEALLTISDKEMLTKLGPFGDFFGGMLNPILSFCTFMALLMTIVLQQKELSLTRKELSETQKATRDSAEALKEQSNSIKLQNFENTFFNMLDLYFNLKNRLNQNQLEVQNINYKINNIDYVFNTKTHEKNIKLKKEGIPMLHHILFLFLNEANRFPKEFRDIPIDKIDMKIKLKYKKNQLNDTKNLYIYFTNTYGKYLNHLMRTIYHIVNFVESNDNIENKKFYVNLLRSQIDISETSLIFYNAISKYGENMLPLLIKYEFFEHLIYNDFICRPTLKLYIEKTKQLDKRYPINKAFGKHHQYKKLLKELDKKTNTSSQEQQ